MSTNSTITNDEFIPGRKLLVHLSENGHSFEFECNGTTPIEAVQRSIETLSGVQFTDQLLMCGKISLDPQQQLAYYKLPQDDREVFLYNKAKLLADSPKPSPESIDIPNAHIPSHESIDNKHPLDDASDPALKALASYEKKFRYHFQYANAFYMSTQAKFELCKRLLREQQVQERALETARGNLEYTFKKLHHKYSEFLRCFNNQYRAHAELLANFERDVEGLRLLKLHPLVQSEGRSCLLDLVKVNDLRKRAEDCFNSHRQLESKVSQLKACFADLKRKVENVCLGMSSNGSKDLEIFIRDQQKVLSDQKSIMQSLSKDVNTVKKLADDCLRSQLSSSFKPHDAVSALGPMYDVHEKNNLPKVQLCDNITAKLLDKCKIKKDNMNLLVHVSMQKVKSVQTSIKDIMNQLHAFEEAIGQQDIEFENLKFVNGIGHAYRACLAEVIRRKSSFKLYMGLAGQLAERLATERDAEMRRRDGFYKAWSKYIPHDIFASMGLFDSPSQVDVNIAPFDKDLLDIDVADVDRYAPQSMIGSTSKPDKAATENIDISEETDVQSHMIDIAGTSKIEVENARLKAELASAIALMCTFNAGIGYNPYEMEDQDEVLKIMKEKTTEALQSKDEYVKHLESMLNSKHAQCASYEKRIQELEQRLDDQYMQGPKFSTQMPCASSVSMDEGSATSGLDQKQDNISVGEARKIGECGDENMSDLMGNCIMDASMQEMNRDEQQVGDNENVEVAVENESPDGDENRVDVSLNAKSRDDSVLELQQALEEKSNQLIETEKQLNAAMVEIGSLRADLEANQNLLDESQMNCAHLENCLHEAREEARTNLCAADRRASEYSALRTSTVRIHSLIERFRNCVTENVGRASFADTLRSLSLSLASSVGEDEDDCAVVFRLSVGVLSDKVGLLSRQRSELLERCSRAEAALKEKTEQINSLYSKHQIEKQASKEKISFVRLDVHELACFYLNSSGNYEAIHRSSFNYYLSSESVALFTEHYSGRPPYIIGQIVHIERKKVEADSSNNNNIRKANPYGLQAGCEYFIVTVAMLPDAICSAAPS